MSKSKSEKKDKKRKAKKALPDAFNMTTRKRFKDDNDSDFFD